MKAVGSAVPVFGGFLYYIGRRYAESYYEVLGVPNEALGFSVADYLFASVRSWMFLLAIALTLLVFALWQSVSEKARSTLETPDQRSKKESKCATLINAGRVLIRAFRYRKGDPQLLMLGYFFHSVLGLALLLLLVLPTAEPSFRAEAVVVTTMLVFSVGLAWLIATDQPTMHFIRARKKLRQLFVASTIITIVVSMQLLPHGIGRFVGIMQTDPYRIDRFLPAIRITAGRALWSGDIQWVERDGMYETQDTLIMILQNNDGLFVRRIMEEGTSDVFRRKTLSDTYYIPRASIEGLSISMPGELPKTEESYESLQVHDR